MACSSASCSRLAISTCVLTSSATVVVVLLLDELARRLAGAEPADLRLVALDHLRVLLVEPLVDLLAVDRHLDVLLARADFLDLDRLLELDRLLGRGGRGGALAGVGCGHVGAVFREFPDWRRRPSVLLRRLTASRDRVWENEEPGSWGEG